MEQGKHNLRLALVLAFMVVMLVVISIDQFRSQNGAKDQEASALRVYAK